MWEQQPNEGAESTAGDERAEAANQGIRSGRIGRREYLRALGSASLAGVLGSTTVSTVTAQAGFDEAAADRRIRENQMGPLTVEVVDADGNPVPDAGVTVEMLEHDFVFGTAIGADLLVNQYGDGHPYRENLLDLFNTAVLGNQHKWAFWERERDLADAAVDWLDRNGFRVRGHTCVYGVDYAIPGDVRTAIQNDNGQRVRERSMQHIEDIITHYGDTVGEWDVVNEAAHRGLLQSAVYPDRMDTNDLAGSEVKPWTSQLLADWYGKAESVIDRNGLDVDVVTNDYNTLTWAQDRYAEEVRHLDSQGVGVDAVGHQAHIGPTNSAGQPWTYATIDQAFERFADLPGAQRITEFDMYGDDWTGQRQRTKIFRRFLKTAFGHPDVDEFMIWGMWDQTHWKNEAPFFEADWTEKPALGVYRDLVHGEWWTSEPGSTDDSGQFGVDATLGTHRVTVTVGGQRVTRDVSVTDPDDGTTIQVQAPGTQRPPAVLDRRPRDPDSDGHYEDVTGDGTVNFNDLVAHYQHQDDPGMTDHLDAYDYTDDGDLDFNDLVALYQEMQG